MRCSIVMSDGAHLHLLLVLADNEVVSLQCLDGLLLLVDTGGQDSHLQGSRRASVQ